jgi:hypothetical protein
MNKIEETPQNTQVGIIKAGAYPWRIKLLIIKPMYTLIGAQAAAISV